MKAIIVVGLGFGDEAKGSVVDALVRLCGSKVVIRYSGGCQCGHNVVCEDGRRHVFSQFGSGTFAGASTYLSRHVIIDPLAMHREAEALEKLNVAKPMDLMHVHPKALVATPYLRTLNRIRETTRYGPRHGTCGHGIGETRSYWLKHGSDAIFAEDLLRRAVLRDKLHLQKERVKLAVAEMPIGPDRRDLAWLYSSITGLPVSVATDQLAAKAIRNLSAPRNLEGTVIFEGAQGVLLDEYYGFHPHTTWSTVTSAQAFDVIRELCYGEPRTKVLGIVRSYMTRHGCGPLPSEYHVADWCDSGNPYNEWQESIRCGAFDLSLLDYAVGCEEGRLAGIFVNHLDEMPRGRFETVEYDDIELCAVPNLEMQERSGRGLEDVRPIPTWYGSEADFLGAIQITAGLPILGTGRGPSHKDKSFSEKLFDF